MSYDFLKIDRTLDIYQNDDEDKSWEGEKAEMSRLMNITEDRDILSRIGMGSYVRYQPPNARMCPPPKQSI